MSLLENLPETFMNKRIMTKTIRKDAILTLLEVDSDIVDISGNVNQILITPTFTKGSSDGVILRVYFSTDNTNWKMLSIRSNDGTYDSYAENPILITTEEPIEIPIPVKTGYVKVSAQGTTDITNTSLQLDITVGNV